MPRNSAGVYTLPAGNPVVPNTLIESDNWANPTLSDIATEITNSLDRSGRGGMTGPFGVVDGTLAAPGLRFTTDPNNGLHRIGTDNWTLVAGGVSVLQLAPTLMTVPNGIDLQLLTGIPANDASAVRKDYVDAAFDATDLIYLKMAGGTMFGELNIGKSSTISYTADTDAVMWYLGKAAGNRFTLFNAISGIESISVDPTSGDITFGKNARLPSGDLQFPGGSGVSFYQPDGTTEQWKLAGGLFSGDGDFGIYNVVAANWALLINTTDNQLTFGGTTKYPNNTAMRMIDSNGADRWLLGKGGGTDNRFVLYNLVAGLDAFAFNPDNNNGTFGGTLYANALFSGMEGSGLEKYIGFSGNQGIAGPYLFFSGNAVFVGLYWDPVGTIWIYDRSTGNLNLPAPGSIRGKSFVATPNPS